MDSRCRPNSTKVDSFLNNESNLGIEAPKGLGKTFLIKCKRIKSQEKGIKCIPQDSMCDILDKITLEDSMYTYLEDYTNWIDLWRISICIAVIRLDVLSEDVLLDLLDTFSNENNSLFDKIYYSKFIATPCQVMNYLIKSNRSSVRELQLLLPILIAAIKTINQPIHVFIDKTDQALRDNLHFINGATNVTRGPSNNSYWAYGQVALAEAAYNIYVQNAHLKVFFTIRSEAMVGAEAYTNLFLQIRSYITKLEYSYSELEEMFKHYVYIEKDQYLVSPMDKNVSQAKAFIGVEKIPHGYVKDINNQYVQETFFEYLFRHTLKRPRDIMHICYNLCYSEVKQQTSEKDRCRIIRHIINRESRLILQAYLREMGPFVFDRYAEQWDQFWRVVEKNVFTINYARIICADINKILQEEKTSCNKNCVECRSFKPFSALYNTGLLGIIANNNVDDDTPKIHFQGTGNTIINTDESLLPASGLYFLHPMLTNKIENTRQNNGLRFDICRRMIIGDGREVEETSIRFINRQENDMLNRRSINSIFLSSTCHDLDDYRKMLFKELRQNDYCVIMSEKNDFGIPDIDSNSYDFCLDNVLKCKKMIFIIGERYGGPYQGKRYLNEAREIGGINKNLKEPSISLMEFYLAHKNKIDTYVYVKKDIYNERNSYQKNKEKMEYIPTFAKDNRVFEIISFITKLPANNWIKTYEDLPDLLEIIKIVFGKTY